MKAGDKVRTTKGCRINGPGGILIVMETGKKWAEYDAIKCEKSDGTTRLYLLKNLIKA